MCIPIIGRLRAIWDEAFFKLRVSSGKLVSRKKIFLDSNHHIETRLDVVVEVPEVQGSVAFEFWINEEFIEYWSSDLMCESPHATNFVEFPLYNVITRLCVQ